MVDHGRDMIHDEFFAVGQAIAFWYIGLHDQTVAQSLAIVDDVIEIACLQNIPGGKMNISDTASHRQMVAGKLPEGSQLPYG